jgi:integrase/recombinase XerD
VSTGPEAQLPDWRECLAVLEGAYAPGTLRELFRHLELFAAWCAERGLRELPAAPRTVADHVLEIFPRYSARSVAIRLASIRRAHQLMDLPDPTRTFAVQLAYRTGLRLHGGAPAAGERAQCAAPGPPAGRLS